MKRKIAGYALCAVLAGCATPQIGADIAALGKAGAAAADALRPALETAAAQERRTRRDAAIAAREILYRPTPGCAAYAARVPGASLSECKMSNEALAPPPPGSARRALAQLDALGAYSEALRALAASDSPDEIGTATTSVIAAVEDLSDTRPGAGLAAFAASLADREDPLEAAATRAARHAQYRALRRVVTAADPAVDTVVDALVAYYDSSALGDERAAYAAMKSAEDRMRAARRSGSVNLYGVAVSDFEAAFATYKKRAAASPVARLSAFREAHAALERRLNAPRDPEEIVAYLEELKDLSDALEAP